MGQYCHHIAGESEEEGVVFKCPFAADLTCCISDKKVITPFTSTLGDRTTDLLPSVSAILWSETFITPALRILDGGGFLQKHILAPRAMTQEQMNLNFLGTPYNLGERYTVRLVIAGSAIVKPTTLAHP